MRTGRWLSAIAIIVLLAGAVQKAAAAIYPAEGTVLPFTLMPFSVPAEALAREYTFCVATGLYDDDRQFAQNVIATFRSKQSDCLARLPHWGTQYTWQATCTDKNGRKISATGLNHFSTISISFVDTTVFRQRSILNTFPDTSLHYFVDAARALYDMSGNAVWVLPNIPGHVNMESQIRDLKVTPFHTITFLTDYGAYEVSYDGRILWSKQEMDPRTGLPAYRHFHHEFTRLPSGNYMLLGIQKVQRKMTELNSGSVAEARNVIRGANGTYLVVDFGVLQEYTPGGDLVWSWNSGDYFSDEEVFEKLDQTPRLVADGHFNAFYFDRDAKAVYAGFRDRNRIVKISYPNNRIIAAFGDGTPTGPLFKAQHSCMPGENGELYIFCNNPSRTMPVPPLRGALTPGERPQSRQMPGTQQEAGYPQKTQVMVLRQPLSEADTARVVWSFDCDIDDQADHTALREGNAVPLPGGNVLVCMGTTPRIFIVSRDKKLMFNSISEYRPGGKEPWAPKASYRVSPVTQEQLERMAMRMLR